MPVRPDLVECWVFRVDGGAEPEFLLIRRADDRIFPGIWQPVTGGIEPGEAVPAAALREVVEETGFGGDALEAFYDLDQVTSFFAEDLDAVVHAVLFAVRVAPGRDARISPEHVDAVWVDATEAARRSIWPPYRQALDLIGRLVAEPEVAAWFALDLEGRRLARPPR